MTIEEDKVTTEVAPIEENVTDKLSNREALSKALSESREDKPVIEESVPTIKEVKSAVAIDPEPPSEFSGAGREAWKSKDIAGIQREFKRIHDGRTQEVTRVQAEARRLSEESKTYKDLARTIAPYIEARGADGTTPEKAMMEAVNLIQELKKNPKGARAELEKLGFDFSGEGAVKKDDSKIDALHQSVNALLEDNKAQKFERVTQTFTASFHKLAEAKTRTGDPVFPDLFDESEKGIKFATELGSLTSDTKFQQGVLRRFPDADHVVLVREAYKYLGGRVADESVKVSKSNQQQIDKSRRAAASTPGGITRKVGSDAAIGKLSNRAALVKALQESREH